MKIKIARILTIIAVLAVIIVSTLLYIGPNRCPLCGFIKSHAPCLVNVKTGKVEEMALYTPHYKLVGEIAEVQDDSTFSFVDVAGAKGTRLSSPWIMELDVPVMDAPIFKYHFCRDCRKLLSGHDGYVIADLYIHGEPAVYEIYDGMKLDLRCYTISAEKSDIGNEYAFTIEGTYQKGQ